MTAIRAASSLGVARRFVAGRRADPTAAAILSDAARPPLIGTGSRSSAAMEAVLMRGAELWCQLSPTMIASASRTGRVRGGLVVVVVSPIGWNAPPPTA